MLRDINALIAAEVLSRAAGEGDLTITERPREGGGTFFTAERPGGFWGADTPEGVARAIVSSLFNDLQHLSQEEIARQFGLIDPRDIGRKGGAATTEAKRAASAANGKKGGRPKKTTGEN